MRHRVEGGFRAQRDGWHTFEHGNCGVRIGNLTERVLENAGPLRALPPPEQDEPNQAKAANEGENRDEDCDNYRAPVA